MSNDSPPRACLADFGFMAAVPDPAQQIAHSAQLEGGTMTFMAPELLIPEEFDKKDAIPTPQSDIYAFGLVVFQVREQGYGYLLLLCITLSRSSRVKCHSVVFGNLRWRIMSFVARAQPNQRTPWPSGFLIRCGFSLKAAGMVR